jgi:hypothetical protein
MENTTTNQEEIPLAPKPSCIPPRLFDRNDFGLICDGSVNYVYNEDGTIDWRKMVKPEFLVPHKQVFEKTGRPVPESIEGLTDKELLILLGGIKELAATRGFSRCEYSVVSPTNEYVIAICKMSWIPNYETQGREVTTSGIGDASPFNTTSFGKLYLAPFAENRAFVRCVRQFLRINVVSQEEISEMANEAAEDVATTLLRDTLNKFNVPFDKIKAKLIEEGVEGAANYKSINDIPRYKQFELIERVKRAAVEAAKAAQKAPTS